MYQIIVKLPKKNLTLQPYSSRTVAKVTNESEKRGFPLSVRMLCTPYEEIQLKPICLEFGRRWEIRGFLPSNDSFIKKMMNNSGRRAMSTDSGNKKDGEKEEEKVNDGMIRLKIEQDLISGKDWFQGKGGSCYKPDGSPGPCESVLNEKSGEKKPDEKKEQPKLLEISTVPTPSGQGANKVFFNAKKENDSIENPEGTSNIPEDQPDFMPIKNNAEDGPKVIWKEEPKRITPSEWEPRNINHSELEERLQKFNQSFQLNGPLSKRYYIKNEKMPPIETVKSENDVNVKEKKKKVTSKELDKPKTNAIVPKIPEIKQTTNYILFGAVAEVNPQGTLNVFKEKKIYDWLRSSIFQSLEEIPPQGWQKNASSPKEPSKLPEMPRNTSPIVAPLFHQPDDAKTENGALAWCQLLGFKDKQLIFSKDVSKTPSNEVVISEPETISEHEKLATLIVNKLNEVDKNENLGLNDIYEKEHIQTEVPTRNELKFGSIGEANLTVKRLDHKIKSLLEKGKVAALNVTKDNLREEVNNVDEKKTLGSTEQSKLIDNTLKDKKDEIFNIQPVDDILSKKAEKIEEKCEKNPINSAFQSKLLENNFTDILNRIPYENKQISTNKVDATKNKDNEDKKVIVNSKETLTLEKENKEKKILEFSPQKSLDDFKEKTIVSDIENQFSNSKLQKNISNLIIDEKLKKKTATLNASTTNINGKEHIEKRTIQVPKMDETSSEWAKKVFKEATKVKILEDQLSDNKSTPSINEKGKTELCELDKEIKVPTKTINIGEQLLDNKAPDSPNTCMNLITKENLASMSTLESKLENPTSENANKNIEETCKVGSTVKYAKEDVKNSTKAEAIQDQSSISSNLLNNEIVKEKAAEVMPSTITKSQNTEETKFRKDFDEINNAKTTPQQLLSSSNLLNNANATLNAMPSTTIKSKEVPNIEETQPGKDFDETDNTKTTPEQFSSSKLLANSNLWNDTTSSNIVNNKEEIKENSVQNPKKDETKPENEKESDKTLKKEENKSICRKIWEDCTLNNPEMPSKIVSAKANDISEIKESIIPCGKEEISDGSLITSCGLQINKSPVIEEPKTDEERLAEAAENVKISKKIVDFTDEEVGPGASKEGTYKNPEYFSYHSLSYLNAELELVCYRTHQPSTFIPQKMKKLK